MFNFDHFRWFLRPNGRRQLKRQTKVRKMQQDGVRKMQQDRTLPGERSNLIESKLPTLVLPNTAEELPDTPPNIIQELPNITNTPPNIIQELPNITNTPPNIIQELPNITNTPPNIIPEHKLPLNREMKELQMQMELEFQAGCRLQNPVLYPILRLG
jgi:hypothetical protein